MEMGSGFLAESGSSNASCPPIESVNGLNFGKKVYFENVGAGAPAKSGTGSSSSGSGVLARKTQGGQQPPRCQVEGCQVDLSDAKAYYSRHKVCGMHSKSPMVIVAGLEQRFCQQCSRFHQLREFDQGKRSCRRRLAGHNERRRKPPPGSLLSARYGRFSSTIFGKTLPKGNHFQCLSFRLPYGNISDVLSCFKVLIHYSLDLTISDNNNRVGSFLLDFSAYPRPSGRDAWLSQRSSEWVHASQTTGAGSSILQPWQNSSQSTPSNIYLPVSVDGTGFSGSRIPSGECFTGVNVADSSCALSLLSNQPWGSRNRASGLEVNSFMNAEGPPMVPPTAPHDSAAKQYPSPSWGFKGNEMGSSSREMCPNLGLGQISQPLNSQFSSGVDLSQPNTRQYMEPERSRAYDSSTTHVHWSL